MSYFRQPDEPRPCWYCHHFGRWSASGINVDCARPGSMPGIGQPEYGCTDWEREPGSDDAPIVPPRFREQKR